MSMGPLWTPRGSLVTSDLLGKNQHKFFTVCGKKTTHSRCLELTWPMAVILAHDKTVPQRVQGLPADCDSAGLPGPACVLAEPASVRGDGAPSCKQRGMSSRNSRGRQCLFKRQMERMLEENLVEFSCMLSHFSHVRLFATPWTVACQAPRSTGFSRQEWRVIDQSSTTNSSSYL